MSKFKLKHTITIKAKSNPHCHSLVLLWNSSGPLPGSIFLSLLWGGGVWDQNYISHPSKAIRKGCLLVSYIVVVGLGLIQMLNSSHITCLSNIVLRTLSSHVIKQLLPSAPAMLAPPDWQRHLDTVRTAYAATLLLSSVSCSLPPSPWAAPPGLPAPPQPPVTTTNQFKWN